MRKKITQIFGYLDLLSAISIFQLVLTQPNHLGTNWFQLTKITLGISLLISGYLLIKDKNWGIYLNYLQFIPRYLFYTGLSFGFIYLISSLFKVYLESNKTLFIVLSFIELIRLIITIITHKKSKNYHSIKKAGA